jgi:hypothetical protein
MARLSNCTIVHEVLIELRLNKTAGIVAFNKFFEGSAVLLGVWLEDVESIQGVKLCHSGENGRTLNLQVSLVNVQDNLRHRNQGILHLQLKTKPRPRHPQDQHQTFKLASSNSSDLALASGCSTWKLSSGLR